MCVHAFFSCFSFFMSWKYFILLTPVESVLRSWLRDFSAFFHLWFKSILYQGGQVKSRLNEEFLYTTGL